MEWILVAIHVSLLKLFLLKMENHNETIPSKHPRPRCKNCEKKISKPGSFCPHCGQRDFDGRVRMRDLLGKLFASFTHLDNKFVKMAWHLFVPARVTINYFQGKIKRYPHPVQFFFIVMFFFLLLLNKQFDGAGFNMTSGNMAIGGNATYEIKKGAGKLAETGLYEALQHCVSAKEHRSAFDSLPLEWQTPVVRQSIDSVVRIVEGPWESATQYFLDIANEAGKGRIPPSTLDTITLNFVNSSVRVATTDLVRLPADSIIQQYGFKDWHQKVTVRQGIKSFQDPKTLIHSYVGSFGWTVLMLIAILSLVLKLLYWRQGGYYVEHFIFLMHQQSAVFLLLTFAMLANEYLIPIGPGWFLILAWPGVSMLLAMKQFYRENWWWTIAKCLVYTVLYVFGLIALFILTLLVVFVVF